MGRRKIEIKAIKDDRNRSVYVGERAFAATRLTVCSTFLKRKGGLFKKAYELSILCSVDVAIIIFDQKKKLYEFSSGNIQDTLRHYHYYGGPHEHKGPSDFKGGEDDDEEDEDNLDSPQPDDASPPHHGIISHSFQSQSGLQHMRNATPSASPPIPNGIFPHRGSTTHSQGDSRPTSRNNIRRESSNLAPHNHPHSHVPQSNALPMTYSYQPNAPFYHPQHVAAANMHMHTQQVSHMPQHQFTHPPPHSQIQSVYVNDQRRQSMPAIFPPQGHQDRLRHIGSHLSPPQPPRPFQSPTLPEPKLMSNATKSHSIYTPLDDTRSMLAQHWSATNNADAQRSEPLPKADPTSRSQSVDVGLGVRKMENGFLSPRSSQKRTVPGEALPKPPPRPTSTSGIGSFAPPPRMNSMSADVKRPRLTVKIPSEQSDGGSATGESSPKDAGGTSIATPIRAPTENGRPSGIILPPPSPSASAGASTSAGASGPINPFARPPVPLNNSTLYKDSETPMSALPSRFVEGLLASPNSSLFYQDWNSGQMGNINNPASPAIYQPTPTGINGLSFRDGDLERKRKSDEEIGELASKKQKT